MKLFNGLEDVEETIELTEAEPVTAGAIVDVKDNAVEVATDTANIENDLSTLKDATAAADTLGDKIEAIETAETVTQEMFNELKHAYTAACAVTGYKSKRIGLESIDVNMEDFKSVLSGIIEGIKQFLKDLEIKIKKLILSILVYVNNDEKNAAALYELVKKKHDEVGEKAYSDVMGHLFGTGKSADGVSSAVSSLYKSIAGIYWLEGTDGGVTDRFMSYLDAKNIYFILPIKDVSKFASVDDFSMVFNDDHELRGIDPKLVNDDCIPKLKEYEESRSYITSIKADTLKILTSVYKPGTKEIIDLEYTTHKLTGMAAGKIVDGNYQLIGDFTMHSIIRLANTVKISSSNIKKMQPFYDEYMKTCENAVKYIEAEQKKNPEDKSHASRLRDIRKLATINSNMIIDGIKSYMYINHTLIKILRLMSDSATSENDDA